jgi:hypothetical protein
MAKKGRSLTWKHSRRLWAYGDGSFINMITIQGVVFESGAMWL